MLPPDNSPSQTYSVLKLSVGANIARKDLERLTSLERRQFHFPGFGHGNVHRLFFIFTETVLACKRLSMDHLETFALRFKPDPAARNGPLARRDFDRKALRFAEAN